MKALENPGTGEPIKVIYKPDTVTYRGEDYPCILTLFQDKESGEVFTTTESDTVWFNQVTNQYRAKYGIPYTDEIIALRERYGVSAAKMSVILGFGINQYRLYEMGEVPSESNGKMIRGAMNPRVFLDFVESSRSQLTEREYAKITARVEEVIKQIPEWHEERLAVGRIFRTRRGLGNGFAPQSMSRLKNLLLHVIRQMGDVFQTKMNKVLFYIDFLSYREHGMAISGLAYNAIDFGPVPQRWDRVYSAFDEIVPQSRLVQEQECIVLTATADADTSCFVDRELAVIDTVCEKMKSLSAHDISELSHNELAWQRHLHQLETIPYEEAFNLVMV
jgi:uncharacterized phage-associated protein